MWLQHRACSSLAYSSSWMLRLAIAERTRFQMTLSWARCHARTVWAIESSLAINSCRDAESSSARMQESHFRFSGGTVSLVERVKTLPHRHLIFHQIPESCSIRVASPHGEPTPHSPRGSFGSGGLKNVQHHPSTISWRSSSVLNSAS